MARTVFVIGPPALPTPTLELIDRGNDQIVDTIALTEAVNWKGRYNGVLTVLVGKQYGAVLKSSGVPIGSFAYCRVTAIDGEAAEVKDSAGADDAPRFDDQHKMTSQGGNEIFVTLADESAP